MKMTISVMVEQDDLLIIDKAAKKDKRNRSSFLIAAGVEKAKSLGVDVDAC
jgi:uncharacterized protein (DUF1778 family)